VDQQNILGISSNRDDILYQEHDMKPQNLPQKQDQTTVDVNSVTPTPLLELNDPGFPEQRPRPTITEN
jgi:hypothetical protein